MRKITCLIAIFTIMLQYSFSQENHSRIKILNPSQETLNLLAEEGIDLRCGVKHVQNNLILDVSAHDKSLLQQFGITYSVEIDDLETYQSLKIENDLPYAKSQLALERAQSLSQKNMQTAKRGSVSETLIESYLQYGELNEKDWSLPSEFNLGSMGGCLTLSEMETELDSMRTYSVSNGLNIVSAKQDASSTGQTTWGNPSSTITNNGLTYNGIGTSRWDPNTIYYVRITGNESTTPEGTKPQMLFTSMIHSREVSALMNNIYFMWYLIENYDTDPAIKNLVDNNELYFVPVVNPDGLRWNEHLNPSGTGMQRKNLRPGAGGTSNSSSNRGVDLNRNFDYFWGSAGSGSSGTASSDSYRGPSAASEPETQIMVDFILSRNFKTAIWNHTYANSIPHPYGGNPTFVSGREDEMHKWHEDMTKYNRYVSGATIFTPANGIADDWMVGGSADTNGSVGSGQNILATTPEHGGEGFWPSPSSIVPIAKRSVRISLMGAYHGGKYAVFHDLTQSDINSTSANLDFAIERVGQTASNFTLNVTPISSNITNITPPATQTGMAILEQRNVSASITLDPSIQPDDKIAYKIQLSNDDGVFYEANIEKYYQPSVLFSHDADTDGLTGWTNSGWSNSSADAYSGSNALRTGNTAPYANNTTKTLTTTGSYDLSSSSEVLIQFYSKWDIERNFDLVEFQASTNGSTWTTLNGKYSKPKSSSSTNDHNAKGASDEAFQDNNSSGHIYDGDRMDKWIMEEVTINSSENSTFFEAPSVQFRFRMRTDSGNEFENYSANGEGFFFDNFKIIGLTIPCETTVPTNLDSNSVTASSAEITWDNIPSATYDLRYREVGTSTWIEINDHGSSNYSLTNLDPNTDYEVQVRSRCISSTSEYTDLTTFTTTDLTYCSSTATDTNFYFAINRVQLNTIDNTSGDALYTDFTGLSTTLSKDTNYSISITPQYNITTSYNLGYSVWIDYNRDGDFEDAGEQIFTAGPVSGDSVKSGNFTVPSNIATGNVRMRVALKYNDVPDPCETFTYGEVEDYTIYLFNGLLYSSSTWTPSAPTDLTGAEDIMILDGSYNTSSNIEVNSVTVASGATLNVSKENAITVNGNISNSGDFIMHSDSDEFSSLLLSGSASDNLKYNRHVNSNTNRNDLVAPPFSGESFVDFISNNSNILSNAGETLYLFGPFDKTTSDYLTYSNTEVSTLDAGKGYRTASTDNSTFTFTGAVTTETVNVPIAKTGSTYEIWNLIGNPYPSYIRLEDFLTANISEFDSSTAAVYGYDADNSNGSYWTIWNFAYASANPNTLIAPGQGFFVSSKDGGGNVSFTTAMQTSGSSDDFISGRNNNTPEFGSIVLTSAEKNFSTDIYLTNTSSLGLDLGYDASHFNNAPSDFAIYSELVNENEGKDMAIQAINFNDANDSTIIPLGVNASQGEQVTISLTNSSINTNVYLEDAVTNTFTLLNESEYTFTPSSSISDTGRFYLRFSNQTLSNNESNIDILQIYSNNDKIVIKGTLTSETQAALFDMQGRLVFRNKLNNRSAINTLSTTNISSGVYLLKISDNISSTSKKVIIK